MGKNHQFCRRDLGCHRPRKANPMDFVQDWEEWHRGCIARGGLCAVFYMEMISPTWHGQLFLGENMSLCSTSISISWICIADTYMYVCVWHRYYIYIYIFSLSIIHIYIYIHRYSCKICAFLWVIDQGNRNIRNAFQEIPGIDTVIEHAKSALAAANFWGRPRLWGPGRHDKSLTHRKTLVN